MRVTPLEDAIRSAPFRPFQIHMDGRVFQVDHPEQVWLTPDKSTAIVAQADGHLAILDVELISSLTLGKANRRRPSPAA